MVLLGLGAAGLVGVTCVTRQRRMLAAVIGVTGGGVPVGAANAV